MKKLILLFGLLATSAFPQILHPATTNPLTYYTVSVPVSTTATSLLGLIDAYMQTSRTADYLNYYPSVLWVQYTAATANAGTIYAGDSTVSATQNGAELAAGQGVYETTYNTAANGRIDLTKIYVVSSTGTQTLRIRVKY